MIAFSTLATSTELLSAAAEPIATRDIQVIPPDNADFYEYPLDSSVVAQCNLILADTTLELTATTAFYALLDVSSTIDQSEVALLNSFFDKQNYLFFSLIFLSIPATFVSLFSLNLANRRKQRALAITVSTQKALLRREEDLVRDFLKAVSSRHHARGRPTTTNAKQEHGHPPGRGADVADLAPVAEEAELSASDAVSFRVLPSTPAAQGHTHAPSPLHPSGIAASSQAAPSPGVRSFSPSPMPMSSFRGRINSLHGPSLPSPLAPHQSPGPVGLLPPMSSTSISSGTIAAPPSASGAYSHARSPSPSWDALEDAGMQGAPSRMQPSLQRDGIMRAGRTDGKTRAADEGADALGGSDVQTAAARPGFFRRIFAKKDGTGDASHSALQQGEHQAKKDASKKDASKPRSAADLGLSLSVKISQAISIIRPVLFVQVVSTLLLAVITSLLISLRDPIADSLDTRADASSIVAISTFSSFLHFKRLTDASATPEAEALTESYLHEVMDALESSWDSIIESPALLATVSAQQYLDSTVAGVFLPAEHYFAPFCSAGLEAVVHRLLNLMEASLEIGNSTEEDRAALYLIAAEAVVLTEVLQAGVTQMFNAAHGWLQTSISSMSLGMVAIALFVLLWVAAYFFTYRRTLASLARSGQLISDMVFFVTGDETLTSEDDRAWNN
jgi:hypothetical protein